jgi:RNA polymerase sigma factor (sigma-70 family)
MTLSDAQLLQRYLKDKSEAAFAELARRHFDLVYSAAMRQVAGETEVARDVAQTVFADLARKAHSLTDRTSLTGWLYTSTYFAAAKMVRGERRRRAREQEVVSMQPTTSETEANWENLRLTIDRAMHELEEQERDAVLLRFFEQRELRAVGEALGVSEDAARKRVDRALEKLRAILGRHGLTSDSLSACLIGQAVMPAPAGLAASVSGAAITTTTSSLPAVVQAMIMNKSTSVALITLVLAGAVTCVLLQRRAIQRLRAENSRARTLTETRADESAPANQTQIDAAEFERLRGEHVELLRLRGEVSRLRRQLEDAYAKRPAAVPSATPIKQPQAPPEPVQTFVANADASIAPSQTLVFGGWPTPPGKCTLVFIQPKVVEARSADRLGSVLLEGKFAEVPDELLLTLGLERLKTDSRATSVQSLLSVDELRSLLKTLEETPGVSLLTTPKVQTLEGREAVMSVTEKKTIAGQEHTLGSSLHVEPRIAADGFSVNLTVSARLKKETSLE